MRLRLNYGDLTFPAGLTLDLNGHKLTAYKIIAEGGFTVRGGAPAEGKNVLTADEIAAGGELTLEACTLDCAALTIAFPAEDSGESGEPAVKPAGERIGGLNWYGGIVLINSVMTTGEGTYSSWFPPASGAMLTMDAASSLTLAQDCAEPGQESVKTIAVTAEDTEPIDTGIAVKDGYTYKLLLVDAGYAPLCEAWSGDN